MSNQAETDSRIDFRTGLLLAAGVFIVASGLVLVFPDPPVVGEAGTNEEGPETVDLISDGELVASVDVELAATSQDMETGLSEHSSLDNGEGMLFLHGEEDEYTYGMPEMDFGIDIVFIDSECTITQIHSAEKPGPNESGLEPEHRYTGTGKFVLEVPKGSATDRVSVGDSVLIPDHCE